MTSPIQLIKLALFFTNTTPLRRSLCTTLASIVQCDQILGYYLLDAKVILYCSLVPVNEELVSIVFLFKNI